MRKSIYFILMLTAVALNSCGDLVLFSQKIEGRDPISLEGKYLLEIESDDETLFDTLEFHRVLPYQFIAYSSLVKKDTQNYEADHPHRRGEIFQGEIHQKGNDYFIHKQDEETGKWEIGGFRIKNGQASFLFEALYADEYNQALVNLVKAGKLKVKTETERIHSEKDGSEDSKYKVYETSANARQATKVWRKIIRHAPKLSIQKLEEGARTPATEKALATVAPELLLYPNPSSGMVNLSLGSNQSWKAGLYDLSGRQLNQISFEGKNYSWNLSDLAAGTYLLKVVNEAGTEGKTFKMIRK